MIALEKLFFCHLEQSERSLQKNKEKILRYAQDDNFINIIL
jgi:hypothetical protein